jgi:hypothetical protein
MVMDFRVEPDEHVYPMVESGTPLTQIIFCNIRAVA